MNTLFDNDPVFNQRHRDSKGRFATAEKVAYDKAIKENNYLRYQVEKYRRMAEAVVNSNIRLSRELASLKEKLSNILKS